MDGWLSPQGIFYELGTKTHPELSEILIKRLQICPVYDKLTTRLAHGEYLLEVLGWMRLKEECPEFLEEHWFKESSATLLNGLDSMTKEQWNFISSHVEDLDEFQFELLAPVLGLIE